MNAKKGKYFKKKMTDYVKCNQVKNIYKIPTEKYTLNLAKWKSLET